MTKRDYYDRLSDQLAPSWERDARMADLDPTRWQEAWAIDDWLVTHRDDETVSVAEYRKKCLALRTAYAAWSAPLAVESQQHPLAPTAERITA